MNVVNNFGSGDNCDGRKEKKPVVVVVVAAAWERTCRPMALLRIASVLLAILWLLALAAVMTTTGGSSLPHGPQRVAALKNPEVVLAAAAAAAARASSAAAATPEEEEEEEAVVVPRRPHSIFELSLLGSKSPNDFQQYSPPPRAGDPMSSYSSCDVPLDPDDVSYTLVSQLSDDRIWMIRHHCLRWGTGNPMSIVVFTDRTMDDVMNELTSSSSSSSDAGGSGSGSRGCSAEHLTLQVVQKATYDPGGTEYPVNLLRNLAFSAVRTSHAVYADVDFWPSRDLHSILSNVTVRERLASDGRLAAVIPAFQMNRRCREYADCRERNVPSMPSNREELIRRMTLQRGAVSAFDPTNRGGHGSTRYNAWIDQEDGTFVDLGCVKSNRYEPYLAIRRCAEMPPFQEGFTGYGKNKMTVRRKHARCAFLHILYYLSFHPCTSSCPTVRLRRQFTPPPKPPRRVHLLLTTAKKWAMQLRRVGYKFSQVGGAFLVHYPHLDSKSRLEWNKRPIDASGGGGGRGGAPVAYNEETADKFDWGEFKRARVDALFYDFKRWLEENVPDDSRVPKCEDALNDDYSLWVHRDGGGMVNDEEEGG
jgi:hypothetical protein